MSHLSRNGSWIFALVVLAGCQSTGRMTRTPPEPAAQARNSAPQRQGPVTPSAAIATNPMAPAGRQAATASAPGRMAKGETAKQPDLVIRATAPMVGDLSSGAADQRESRTATELEKVRQLYDHAAAKNSTIRDYVARFRRREVVNAKQMPEDLILFRHLKEPNSLYLKWLPGAKLEGRELVYVPGQYNSQIQVRSGKGDLLSGIRTEVDPRSERATANSRRTIDEAGLDFSLRRLGEVLDVQTQGRNELGTLRYLGSQQRPESKRPFECVVQQIPPGREKHLPRGGVRYWYFCSDPQVEEHGLPTLIVTQDENQREVEYYHFDRFNINIGLKPLDFDPDALWGKR
jgi:hypothetical protein